MCGARRRLAPPGPCFCQSLLACWTKIVLRPRRGRGHPPSWKLTSLLNVGAREVQSCRRFWCSRNAKPASLVDFWAHGVSWTSPLDPLECSVISTGLSQFGVHAGIRGLPSLHIPATDRLIIKPALILWTLGRQGAQCRISMNVQRKGVRKRLRAQECRGND